MKPGIHWTHSFHFSVGVSPCYNCKFLLQLLKTPQKGRLQMFLYRTEAKRRNVAVYFFPWITCNYWEKPLQVLLVFDYPRKLFTKFWCEADRTPKWLKTNAFENAGLQKALLAWWKCLKFFISISVNLYKHHNASFKDTMKAYFFYRPWFLYTTNCAMLFYLF